MPKTTSGGDSGLVSITLVVLPPDPGRRKSGRSVRATVWQGVDRGIWIAVGGGMKSQ